MMKTVREAWESGIDRELSWWRGYLETGGYANLVTRAEFRFRFDPDAVLQPDLVCHLPPEIPAAEIQILDCAAGPATTLGKTVRGERVALTAVDALAGHYKDMLVELSLVAPIPTLQCHVEDLHDLFEANRFDLVYMRFALDHCYDPIAALQQMVRVTRPGGVVMVEHYRDESEIEYQGLRRWSLHPLAGDLIIANEHHRHQVSEEIQGVQIETEFSPTWLTMLLRHS